MNKIIIILLSLTLHFNVWAGINFDGTDDFVNAGDISDVDFGAGDFTFSAWINTDTVAVGAKSIFTKDSNVASGRSFTFAINVYNAGDVYVGIFSAGHPGSVGWEERTTSGSQFSANTDVHIAAKRTSGTITLFVDGVSKATTGSAINGGTENLTIQNSVTDFRVGMHEWPGYEWYFDGTIGNVLIFDSALTDAQIESLAKSKMLRFPISGVTPVLEWPIDSGASGTSADGDTIYDRSGNGNNGTGDDGANNTGLTWDYSSGLGYPPVTQ